MISNSTAKTLEAQGSQLGLSGQKGIYGSPRPSGYTDIQPKVTRSGHPIREIPWSLPYWTTSLCPECRAVIKARKFAEDGKVFMEKECEAHGYFKELISSDVDFYMQLFTQRYGDGRGFSNPLKDNGKTCPQECGVCNMHHSHTCMANIDLTNRCDMSCPVCFANANAMGFVTEPTIEQVREMMRVLRERRPVPTKVLQFSGGEPTIHPNFIEIVAMAREMGFTQIQIATNGKNISDIDFARRCKEAGLHSLYLQFDGVTNDVYKKTRGEDVLEQKLQVVEVCRQTGLRIVLVPTVIKGVNDNQVGAIVKFACDNADVISGISFQPVCFTGRISEKDRLSRRYTITDLAKDIELQTGGMMPLNNWFPLGLTQPLSRLSEAISNKPAFYVSCHPDCGAGGYLFIEPNEKEEIKALSRFFDLRGALSDIQDLAKQISERREGLLFKAVQHLNLKKSSDLFAGLKALKIIKKYFREKDAPTGLTIKRLIGVMDGYKNTDRGRRPDAEKTTSYCTIFVAGMHFQDVYNYDVERAKRCVIHHSAPDGKMYPFCTYNSGPYYRERVEEKTQNLKLKEYKETGDAHASSNRRKRFGPPAGFKPVIKDYGVGSVGNGELVENYGCCSTAKG